MALITTDSKSNFQNLTSPIQNDTTAGHLPDEVLEKVFSFLPTTNIFNCSQVCRRWDMVCQSSILWDNLFSRDFPFARPTSSGIQNAKGNYHDYQSKAIVPKGLIKGNFIIKHNFLKNYFCGNYVGLMKNDFIALGTDGGDILIFNCKTQDLKLLQTQSRSSVHSLLMENNKLIAGTDRIQVWDLTSLACEKTMALPYGAVNALHLKNENELLSFSTGTGE